MKVAINRRKFCMGLAIAGAGMAFASCSPTLSQADDDAQAAEQVEADIAIIGAGLAGMACARAAAQGGARVILVDKAFFLGSTFQTSMGNVSICQIKENEDYWQFVDGEIDTMETFLERYKAMTEVGKLDVPYPDYDRVKTIMEESCKTIAWVEEVGLDFQQSFTKEAVGTDTVKPDTSTTPGTAGGAFFIEKMAAELEGLGVEIMLSSTATELIEEAGMVVGVKVSKGSGSPVNIHAPAIVLATGGFGASEEYCDKLVPAINELGFQYQGNGLNTGDGMTMAAKVGAALYDDCWVIPNVAVPSKKLTDIDSDFSLLCDQSVWGKAFEGGYTSTKMLVNAEGLRFVNEAGPATAIATAMADTGGDPYYVLFDSSNPEITALIEKGLGSGDVFTGENIEALASAAEMDHLTETFVGYSDCTSSGTDSSFGKPSEKLVPYGEGPYYLVKYVPSYVATMGGVQTDEHCRAIREDGSPIEGLYAIGEATHRFMYNRSFVRHCSNSCALTMGRMTGQAIAESLS